MQRGITRKDEEDVSGKNNFNVMEMRKNMVSVQKAIW